MGETVKVIQLTGNSTESWEDAAQNALDDADETLENISGIEIESQTADVEGGTIERYRTTLDVAFVLEGR
ncbi:dodecin domain-containing protein [Haloterrigena sp. SYSU A558-1]|uniref:Dodecin domain-containing protein n=1 Tax=Haloterrigena gelatinilytica TaxID=2741724 RepID=A0A8J8GPD0_9EURY|nr:dodecin family protein [Haloterrigena gelatinilytica]NUB92898.1 dodecin domain-containing protein [Haloterrigena gelatinilytica]NUC71190.1 dodecin domain-containing protein [Haloterrigena gelatinilytica]